MNLFNAKKDVLETMRAKFDAYHAQLSQINADIEAAEGRISTAKAAMEAAADANDSIAFENAKADIAKAETGLEMAQIRRDRLVKNGAASTEEIDAAVKEFEDRLAEINAKASKEILDRLTELNDVIDQAEADAKKVHSAEKDLANICGIDIKSLPDREARGIYIPVTYIRNKWPSNKEINVTFSSWNNIRKWAAQAE